MTVHGMMTPEVAEDWEEAQAPAAAQAPRRAEPEATHRVDRLDLTEPSPPSPMPLKTSERSATGTGGSKRGKSRDLGILPKPKSEPPSFGYGIPAVLKPLPPCAVVATGEEATDLPPEERFQTTYREQFQSHSAVNFHTPEYFPTRFVPAGNRHAKEIKLNSLGAHVARKG